jgi:hypothetical protein
MKEREIGREREGDRGGEREGERGREGERQRERERERERESAGRSRFGFAGNVFDSDLNKKKNSINVII